MTLTIFCGSRIGKNDIYKQEAQKLGILIAKNNFNLVYGGGSVGLMGIISKTAYENGANVVGIIPELLEKREVISHEVTKLIVVNSMHERKAKMANKADVFIAFSGGIGTMEEIFEVWTWAQLGYHKKPVVFLNVNGYYDKLFSFLDFMVNDGFLYKKDRDLIKVFDNSEKMLDYLESLKLNQ